MNLKEYFENRNISYLKNLTSYSHKYNYPVCIYQPINHIVIDANYLIRCMISEIKISNTIDINFDHFIDIHKAKEIFNKINKNINDYLPIIEGCKIIRSNVMLNKRDSELVIKNMNENYIDEFINQLLQNNKNLDWNRSFITGGSLCFLMRNIFYQNDCFNYNSDVDIIVSFNNHEDSIIILKKVIANFLKDIKNYKVEKINQYRYKIFINNVVYDFFAVNIRCILTTIIDFHFSCVRLLYNKFIGLTMSPICLMSNITMMNYLISYNIKEPKKVINKYYKKGYSFLVNEKEYEIIIKALI